MIPEMSQSLSPHLDVLRCPITHQRLRLLDSREIICLQENPGAVVNYSLGRGAFDQEGVSYSLVTADGQYAYPVVKGVLILLKNWALRLNAAPSEFNLSLEKAEVQSFYDQLGWHQSSEGIYADAQKYEDLRPVSRSYIQRCHLRVRHYLSPTGKYFLDAASGPIQYPEYLTYSENYDTRICVDLSLRALVEAKKRLGGKGLYLLADITQLPLASNSIDGAVSLHTIYHVPQSEQLNAFREIYRVLRTGASAAVVYSWGGDALLMKLAQPCATVRGKVGAIARNLKRLAKGVFSSVTKHKPAVSQTVEPCENVQPRLYFHALRRPELLRQLGELRPEIVVWRSVSVAFLTKYIHGQRWGEELLDMIFRLESKFPKFAGKFGQYPMFILRK